MNKYVELVGLFHPGVECTAKGPDYEDIVWKSTVVPKAALDAKASGRAAKEADVAAIDAVDARKDFRALIDWIAPLVGKTPGQARSEIILAHKNLPRN